MDFCATKFSIDKEEGFAYTDHSITNSDGSRFVLLHSVSHNFNGAFDFNGDGRITSGKDNKGKTLGNNTRAPGLYSLTSQEISTKPYTKSIWQYYVRENDGNGSLRSRTTPGDSGFTSFTDFPLKENDEVTWRLVTIQFEPKVPIDAMTAQIAQRASR
jgi:hypothetical protein